MPTENDEESDVVTVSDVEEAEESQDSEVITDEPNPITLETGVVEAQEIKRKEGESLNDHVKAKIEAE